MGGAPRAKVTVPFLRHLACLQNAPAVGQPPFQNSPGSENRALCGVGFYVLRAQEALGGRSCSGTVTRPERCVAGRASSGALTQTQTQTQTMPPAAHLGVRRRRSLQDTARGNQARGKRRGAHREAAARGQLTLRYG